MKIRVCLMSQRLTLIFLLLLLSLPACDGKKSAFDPSIPHAVEVEMRPDGLAYLPGQSKPFSGEAVELHPGWNPPRVAKRTPYVYGKKHGSMTTWTPGRKLREDRRYEHGVAKTSAVYHTNGRIKYQVTLNAKDVAEGHYRRYYPDGELQVEAVFDANEKFHGDEKCYDRNGKLIGHYRHDHGNTLIPVFETHLMKVERLWKMQQGPEPHPSPWDVPFEQQGGPATH